MLNLNIVTLIACSYLFPIPAAIAGVLLFIFRIVYVVGYKFAPRLRMIGMLPITIIQIVMITTALVVPGLVFFKLV